MTGCGRAHAAVHAAVHVLAAAAAPALEPTAASQHAHLPKSGPQPPTPASHPRLTTLTLQPHLRSSSVLMGSTGSLQKMDSWNSCSRRWRKTDTGACGAPPCTGGEVQPHWCSTGGRTRSRCRGRLSRMAPESAPLPLVLNAGPASELESSTVDPCALLPLTATAPPPCTRCAAPASASSSAFTAAAAGEGSLAEAGMRPKVCWISSLVCCARVGLGWVGRRMKAQVGGWVWVVGAAQQRRAAVT